MQVDFKKQVQEWKNILLRGHDPKALDKYSTQFHEQEAAVRKAAEDLSQSVKYPEVQAILRDFLVAHQRMAAGYAAALAAFRASAGQDPHAADAMVKGQDRAPTDLIDTIVERLNARVNGLHAALQAKAAMEQKVIVASVCGLFGLLPFNDETLGTDDQDGRQDCLWGRRSDHRVSRAR
jgi:methyl-accepting chemotaxis protein-1 (serine sensor receptor)